MNVVDTNLPLTSTGERRLSHASPLDSTRSLLGLMQLGQAQPGDEAADDSNPLEGVISRRVLRSLLSALHVRDVATVRHSRRVALLSVALAEYLGWEGRQLKIIEVAALLHDIGKLGVPDNILFKPGKLTPDELELMSLHYNVALNVLQACRVDPIVLEMICNSHAQFSGAAPSRMSWREPSLGARILAIADAYESLSTQQTYRPARSHDEIMHVLSSAAGKEFDGNVVSALARYTQLHGLPLSAHEADLDESITRHRPSSQEEELEAAWLCQAVSQLYLLESLYDGFFVVDADLRLLVWNRGAESLLSLTMFDMLGRTWTSSLLGYVTDNEESLPEAQCPMHIVLQGGGAQATETQLKRGDARLVRVELQTMPLLDEEGRLHGAIEIIRDLTRCQRRQPQAVRDLKLAAARDALTSVANRGELETQLANLVLHHLQNPEEPFSVVFLDADHFKAVNDTYGHAVGDQVLVDLARLLQQETYSGEIVGRYGGEEFVVLCPATDLENAYRRAERLRSAIRSAKIGGVDGLRVTVSFGVSEFEPGDTVESVLRRADRALYQAKQTGRDRTCYQSTIQRDIQPEGDEDGGLHVTEQSQPFVYNNWFTAVIAAHLVTFKLGGYVNDTNARIVKISPDHVVLRQGGGTWFGWWGWSPETQPVEVAIHFERNRSMTERLVSRTFKTQINVTVRPLGWVRRSDVFQARAWQVVRELKEYFAGD
jgi:diguanylate cyclase (GGDEF)-like protein/putative nucleotidyltransferase with HDIG domain